MYPTTFRVITLLLLVLCLTSGATADILCVKKRIKLKQNRSISLSKGVIRVAGECPKGHIELLNTDDEVTPLSASLSGFEVIEEKPFLVISPRNERSTSVSCPDGKSVASGFCGDVLDSFDLMEIPYGNLSADGTTWTCRYRNPSAVATRGAELTIRVSCMPLFNPVEDK